MSDSPSSAALFVSVLGAFGLGTVISSVIGRWSAISGLRQQWSDGLRADVAAYLAEVNALPPIALRANWNTLDPENAVNVVAHEEALKRFRELSTRILLIMKPKSKEKDEIELVRLVEEMHEHPTVDNLKPINARMVILTRSILKREWEKAKHGAMYDPDAADRET